MGCILRSEGRWVPVPHSKHVSHSALRPVSLGVASPEARAASELEGT